MDKVVELTRSLVKIPSPMGKEKDVVDFIVKQVEKSAEALELIEVPGCAASIYATNIVDDDRPTVILNGHVDTVAEAEGWQGSPFEAEVRDGRIYGLGACDMKAGVAIAIDAFRQRAGKDVNLIFSASTDEEGNSLGTYNILKKKDPKAALCLIPEPTDENVMLGCRGRYVVEIAVKGKAAHGARPHLGMNAIEDAARIINNLPRVKIRQHDLLGRGSLCVLKVWGGGDSLSVPERCYIRVDRHIVEGETKEMIIDDFKKAFLPLGLKSGIEFRWMKRPTPFLEPFMTKRTVYVTTFLMAAKANLPPEAGNEVYGESVGDYNLFGARMPTIVCGPSGGDWHSPNEYVDIESIVRIRDLYIHFLEGMTSKG